MPTTAEVRLEIPELLEEALREVLAMMFGMSVEGPEGGLDLEQRSLTGTIGLTGPEFQGLLQIHCSTGAARGFAAAMLGGEEMLGEDASLIEDSLGELANMMGGAVKQRIDQTGVRIEISLPSVVEGELQEEDQDEMAQTTLDFLVEGHPIRATLVHHWSS